MSRVFQSLKKRPPFPKAALLFRHLIYGFGVVGGVQYFAGMAGNFLFFTAVHMGKIARRIFRPQKIQIAAASAM